MKNDNSEKRQKPEGGFYCPMANGELTNIDMKLTMLISLLTKPEEPSEQVHCNELMTRAQAALKLKISERTFDRMRGAGIITAVRVGKTDFFRESDLQEANKISIRKGKI